MTAAQDRERLEAAMARAIYADWPWIDIATGEPVAWDDAPAEARSNYRRSADAALAAIPAALGLDAEELGRVSGSMRTLSAEGSTWCDVARLLRALAS